MKIISFNVNGLRARPHQMQALVEQHRPDIIGLQETKVHDSEFPQEMIDDLGYQVIHHGQKGHYGVATLFKGEVTAVQRGFPGEDPKHQRRMLMTTHSLGNGRILRVLNGYFPQGENREHPEKFPNKRNFYANLKHWLENEADPSELLVVMGDINISHRDDDIGIGADNAKRWLRTGKCSFLPEEREWLEEIYAWGIKDSFRKHHPDTNDRFSWFDYRSRGFNAEPKRGLRIDQIMVTESLYELCSDSGIDYQIRGMEKPSDHCPIWAEFDL
ncbi:exodeoxyribonuclease-3 [Malonomonas rubra DSM 5091]|uniref:Exodeoxyribonuclease-3 n=1 Tax=Malonomonas rubra DSM 5091 TaxID=1122189 RepID=A0A1M6HK19_MALRU|nr:exodeoxyribonuclease III [Malonomonas rubra]SHJ22517.1 exodeoxyribonuclease-3 [Malonomonas rubra DSM 5091]